MRTVELTCIECPVGCALRVYLDGENIKVEGNSCPRGETYGKTEVVAPVRTITSTVRAKNGAMVPVKTDKPVPKKETFYVMNKIKKASCNLPCRIGDVVIKDVVDGVNVVVTANLEIEK